MCSSVCLEPWQRMQVSEAFFSHMWRLELVGRVLREAFRMNSGGRSRTALTHRAGEDSSQALAISPWAGCWQRDWCSASSSSSARRVLTAPVRALRLWGRSCTRMESTRAAGLNSSSASSSPPGDGDLLPS